MAIRHGRPGGVGQTNPKFREISQMSRRPLKLCVMLCPFAAVSFPRQRVDRVGRVSLHG